LIVTTQEGKGFHQRMIENNFDIPFSANLALREKQIQQNYRPVIAVHKWFARRPGTLFRALILSEFSDRPLREAFFRTNAFPELTVLDPFMGGGTSLLEANRVGCNVMGFDINPMSHWIVGEEIGELDLEAYRAAADLLRRSLEHEVGALYRTRCLMCGAADAYVKCFLWVKVITCWGCGCDVDLFPGYLLSGNVRHPLYVFVCPECGELTETADRKAPGFCGNCGAALALEGPAKRNRCACRVCGTENRYPNPELGPPRHRMFAIEYFCPRCRDKVGGRFFKCPDANDLRLVREADTLWRKTTPVYVPDDAIPSGDETNRLHRWGYRYYREMFNERQLIGLETSARLIAQEPSGRIRAALATNLSDLLRYQNMLCRYDTTVLKSLDIFSVHGFPVGLIQCESNLLGVVDPRKNTLVGSGGWANITAKYGKAKEYCRRPFEVKHDGRDKMVVFIPEERIVEASSAKDAAEGRRVDIRCEDAALADLAPGSVDMVLTDPPYFGAVQYAELMDFCYVWLRRLLGVDTPVFAKPSTRHAEELTGNANMGRGIDHFAAGLSRVFRKATSALKRGRPLVFTFHHNDMKAYHPVAVAILDSGLTCTAAIPCPGEMGASIHINGTGSSIIDTVFVCRAPGVCCENDQAIDSGGVAQLVQRDLQNLRNGNVTPTEGDARCIAYGHLTRLAICGLREGWDADAPLAERLRAVQDWLKPYGGWEETRKYLSRLPGPSEMGKAKANRVWRKIGAGGNAPLPF
jgi:adenine-specific DNA methylase